MIMGYKINESVTLDFTTHNPITGQVQDTDFLPTCQVFEDTTDVPIITPVVTKRVGQTGDYRLTFITSPANGFEIGKSYNLIAEATVGGITAKAQISAFNIESAAPPVFMV